MGYGSNLDNQCCSIYMLHRFSLDLRVKKTKQVCNLRWLFHGNNSVVAVKHWWRWSEHICVHIDNNTGKDLRISDVVESVSWEQKQEQSCCGGYLWYPVVLRVMGQVDIHRPRVAPGLCGELYTGTHPNFGDLSLATPETSDLRCEVEAEGCKSANCEAKGKHRAAWLTACVWALLQVGN